MPICIAILVAIMSFGAHLSLAQAQQPTNRLLDVLKGGGRPATSDLPESRLAQGLKEALRVGTEQAVARTGKPNGYFGNPQLKILLPDTLQPVEKGLRLAGYGNQVDAFILSMNQAAEQAAPQAKQIFVHAITSMTFEDARKIFNGGDTAATEFFKDKTSQQLYISFRPVVDDSMNKVGTVQKYNTLLAQTQTLPFVKTKTLDVGHYVTNKALDGLFLVVAEEEQRIRKDPAARVTDLLQDVFGH